MYISDRKVETDGSILVLKMFKVKETGELHQLPLTILPENDIFLKNNKI